MPSEASRPWAYLGLGAAALFATGSVIAVMVASDQRRAEAESAGSSTVALEQRYAAAASDIDAAEAAQLQTGCELDARIVGSVELEQRMEAALEGAGIVQDAYLIINPPDRVVFEESRAAAVEAFAAGFTTDEDAAVAAEYEGVEDVLGACLAAPAPTTPPASGTLTLAAVEELEARAASLEDGSGLDTARFDELDAAVTGFGPAVLQAADAVVNVNRLAATQDALAAAAEPLRTQTAPVQTVDALVALTAHAQAALDRQAGIAAEQAQPVETEEAQQQQQQQQQQAPAPAPVRPQQPAPAPPPPPSPAPSTEPEPTNPGNGGGNGGGNGDDDSLLDPLFP